VKYLDDINVNEIIVNPGAERTILANCLNNQNAIIDCESEGLTPKHFAIEANKVIYSAIVYLFTKNATIDPLSIINIIKDEKAKQEIDKLGGLEYIIMLQQAPTTQNIKMFCQDVMQCFTRRLVYGACTEIQSDMLKSETKDVDSIIGSVTQRVTDITLASTKVQEAYKMGDKLEQRLKTIAETPTEIPGLSTGWAKFDRATKGAQPGDLIIVCAESKTGKSVTLLNWAKHISIDRTLPILWIDTEQSEEEQESRLVSNISQVPESEILTGMFAQDTQFGITSEKVSRLKIANRMLRESQFYHIFMPDFTLEKIQAITRKFHLKYGIVALFFDYINFNPTMMAQNRNLRDDMILTNLATGLKDLGGILKIPVFTAAQENRFGYGSTDKDARNIGGSIGILQKATKLIFLRNKTDEEIALEGGRKGNQKLIVKYQRHGESGIEFDIHYDRFRITQNEV
jgi:replicative DNA helicase